ncbi:hypothetical protein OG780_42120 [Streptomyces sp. NBC_00386]|uniref:hypothetical protein n=1 Tax=Streptomyces sp. NBC_00386 TaxID=2975734 RepID=UPI002E1F617E
MNDEPVAATALVRAEYHLFQIADPQGPVADDLDATQNGLASAVGGVIEVATGIHTGNVRVTVEQHSQRPILLRAGKRSLRCPAIPPPGKCWSHP